MSRNVHLRLQDILDSCKLIESYLAGMTKEAFLKDTKTQDAIARQLEIIGEAVKNIPDELRSREPGIQWRQISGFRDVLAHAYFAIEVSILWNAATKHCPHLRSACERLLE